jgi:uncharacterized membrane protein (DUF2068 family)
MRGLPSKLLRHHTKTEKQLAALRAIATFELAKGLVVLLAAVGALSLVHRDAWDVAGSLLHFLHIGRHHHYVDVFLKLADRVTDERLWLVAGGCVLYSTIRFIEAYGLWRARAWAEWFAFAAGTVYLPFEVYELIRKVTAVRMAILIANLAVILYMLYLRREEHLQMRNPRPQPMLGSGRT